MNGRQRITAALSTGGSAETPVVICYEGIYIRDHWRELTDRPWWDRYSPDLDVQLAWRRDVVARTGQDWLVLPLTYSREQRERLSVQVRPDGAFLVDRRTGVAERLPEPRIGGWTVAEGSESYRPGRLATTPDEIDRLVPVPRDFDPQDVVRDGRGDLAASVLAEFGGLYPICHVSSPLWRCYNLWGFEGMMAMVGERPDLVEHACRRLLTLSVRAVQEAAAIGAAGIWIEECMTDMVSPQSFARLNAPFVRELVEAIRAAGLQSIYYYCGDPSDRWDLLLSAGVDALALEESKKGFIIDVEEVVERVGGRCAVLGNLDAIDLLANGSEEQLRGEIGRQISAGRRNGGRFVMSIGSPVTPATPVARVRRYCDVAREL